MSEQSQLILIVEDDQEMARLNARLLTRRGYAVLAAHTAGEARSFVREAAPDLFVLDVELPDGDGFSLCEEFRQGTDTPVLFLTGKTETKDKVTGLGIGGDYYLTKPYDRDEFLAVVQSLLSREARTREKITKLSVITRGPLTIKLTEHKAYVDGRDAELTSKEFDLLLYLVQNEDKELSGEQLYEGVWKKPIGVDTGVIRKHISEIRKKLGEGNTDEFAILNQRGARYIFTIK